MGTRDQIDRFGDWMGEGMASGRLSSCLVRLAVVLGAFFTVVIAFVLIVNAFSEPACESSSHRWHTTVGKTTVSKCLPDRETGI